MTDAEGSVNLTASMSGGFAFLGEMAPVFFAIGLYGLVHSIIVWRRGARVAGWPTTPGVIVLAHVKKGKSGASDMGHGNNPKATVYRSQIVYSYQVGARELQGTRVQFGARSREYDRLAAQGAVAIYTPGQAVQVHYDPAHPGESALQPGVASFWRTRLLFSAAMLGVGACGWLIAAAAR